MLNQRLRGRAELAQRCLPNIRGNNKHEEGENEADIDCLRKCHDDLDDEDDFIALRSSLLYNNAAITYVMIETTRNVTANGFPTASANQTKTNNDDANNRK